MKKTILTLIISVLCLGLASVLFSLGGNLDKNPKKVEVGLNNLSQPNSLPSSQDTFLTASLNPNFIPIRDWSVEEPDIRAKAGAVFDPQGEKFLYQKNIKEKLPVASLTKIMTAIVVLESLGLDDIVTVSKKAVATEGENGRLIVGEDIGVRSLLYAMLVESSNDAAIALADAVDGDFVALMNQKAKEVGLEDTHFVDPAGISKWNYSTATDLVRLAVYSFNEPLIWQMLGTKEIEVYSQDGKIKHYLVNTNKLLGESANWRTQIIGGKTGFTDEAGSCILTMIKIPEKTGEYLISVILGAEDRELETKKLIEWTEKAYVW